MALPVDLGGNDIIANSINITSASPGLTTTALKGSMLVSSVNGLTAHSGGGQASATPCTAMINRITTVAAAADSCVLPPAVAGQGILIINAGATSMNVFAAGTDLINAAATAFAVASTKVANFYTANTGQWHTLLTA